MAGILLLHLVCSSVKAWNSGCAINKDWKRSFHWQEQAPTPDDSIDWASLDRQLAGSPSSSGGVDSTTGFRKWFASYHPQLAAEWIRLDYLRVRPNGRKADAYRQKTTRSEAEIRQDIKDNHPIAYQRLLEEAKRRKRKYEDSYKSLREQEKAKTIGDADKEKLEDHRSKVNAHHRRWKQKKSSGH